MIAKFPIAKYYSFINVNETGGRIFVHTGATNIKTTTDKSRELQININYKNTSLFWHPFKDMRAVFPLVIRL